MEVASQSVDANGEHIPRPRNSFMLYSQDKRPFLQGSGKDKSLIIGSMWKNESKEVKTQYKQLAEAEKRRHAEKYPNYGYHPGMKKVNKGQKRAPRQAAPKKQKLEASSNMEMPMTMMSVPGHQVAVAQSTMPLASLSYPTIPVPPANAPSPSTVSSPSLGPVTPRDFSPVTAPFVPAFQSIPRAFQSISQAPLSHATSSEVDYRGLLLAPARANETVPIQNYQGIMANLPSLSGRFTSPAYDNIPITSIPGPAASESATAINWCSSVETSVTSAYEGVNYNTSAQQLIEMNFNEQTASDASIYHFGSAPEKAHSQPPPSNSFTPSVFINNTGVSSLNATAISSTPDPTKLLAAHYASREASAQTGSNHTSSDINIVNTVARNPQSLPVLASSFPPSAYVNNSNVLSSSATVNYATPFPTELLSVHYAGRGVSAEQVTNYATGRTAPEATINIRNMNPSVLAANSGALNFSPISRPAATSGPVATVCSSAPPFTSPLAAYNTVPQAPANEVVEDLNNFFDEYSPEDAAAVFVLNAIQKGETEGLGAWIAQFEKEANI